MIDLCAKIDRLIFKNRKQILFDDFHYQIFENVKDVPVELWQKANEANHFFFEFRIPPCK